MSRFLFLALLLAACTEKSRSTDTRSTSLPTAKERVAFFCDYVLCPTRPDDVAFHLVYRDNSGGFIPGPDDATIHAVLKVPAADLAQWSRGCFPGGADARPAWLADVLKGTGWSPKTAPDIARCGAQTRVIHVKEGLVILTDERH
jgi:hypothetical protein